MKLPLRIIFLSLIFLCIADSAQAALVQCGNSSVFDERCKLCHLIEGMDKIIDWGMQILVVCALLGIVAGGIMYIISAGNSGMMESAKGLIKQALWGVVIVLGAWVIVNTTLWMIGSKIREDGPGNFLDITNWYSFKCEGGGSGTDGAITEEILIPRDVNGTCPEGTVADNFADGTPACRAVSAAKCSGTGSGCPDGYSCHNTVCVPSGYVADGTNNSNDSDDGNQTDGTTDTDGDLPVDGDNNTNTNTNTTGTTDTPTSTSDNNISPLDEIGIREFFDDNGIKINNPNACATGQTSGCTTVAGLRDNTISGVGTLKSACGDECNVTITGGTEGSGIHSQSGVYNHVNGYKVDLRPNAELDNFIKTNYERIPGTRSDGAIGYKDGTGDVYYYEEGTSTQGPHWDVTYY